MNALTNLGYLIFTFLFFQIVKFIFQPYNNWKNQKRKSAGIDDITIQTADKKYSYVQYLEKFANKKVDISLIIPAYNEEQRLPKMLKETIPYFENLGMTYEILVVSDASKDKTSQVALSYANYQNQKIDIASIEYKINKGKGGAVRHGMLLANGDYKLFLDADGATEISEFSKLYKNMKEIEIKTDNKVFGIAAGSRNHLQKDVIKQRKWYRNILMHISNFIVNQVCGVKLKDTQCGFKLFTADSANIIFKTLHLERWAFDVEIFMIANYFKIPSIEIPVNWQDVDGSKLNVIEASITMARDFFVVRVYYLLGMWSFTDTILQN